MTTAAYIPKRPCNAATAPRPAKVSPLTQPSRHLPAILQHCISLHSPPPPPPPPPPLPLPASSHSSTASPTVLLSLHSSVLSFWAAPVGCKGSKGLPKRERRAVSQVFSNNNDHREAMSSTVVVVVHRYTKWSFLSARQECLQGGAWLAAAETKGLADGTTIPWWCFGQPALATATQTKPVRTLGSKCFRNSRPFGLRSP